MKKYQQLLADELEMIPAGADLYAHEVIKLFHFVDPRNSG